MQLITKPVLCNYYVTYRCNASCHFCDIWEKPSPYVTYNQVEENLVALKEIGVKVIDFTGGEPLLHGEIHRFLSLAKDLGFITTLTTNCLLYPKKAAFLKGNVDMLHFSLDAFDAELHNKGRGVACYDFVLKSIAIAKSLGERPDILFTVLEDNKDQIEQVYEEICMPNELMLILNPAFDYANKNVDKWNLELDKELRMWSSKKYVYLNKAFLDLRKDGGNNIKKPVCKAGSATVVISPMNELISPCYHLSKHTFNIDENDGLVNLYEQQEVKSALDKAGKYLECQGCTINCYMQPSFATNLNKYWFKSLSSTIKYNLIKDTWKQLLPSGIK